MKKSYMFTLLVFLILIPLTIYFGRSLSGKGYYLVAFAIIGELLIPFFMTFERSKPTARELVMLAVMCAIAIISRVAIPIPNFKAIYAVIMLSGMAFGPERGFIVGAISAFASNFFYGQGAYLPWQMLAYGAGGMLAGFVFNCKMLSKKAISMAVFGFFAVVLFVGPILDSAHVFIMMPSLSMISVKASLLSGFPINVSQGVCTALVMFFFGEPMLEKLQRVKNKYGIAEDENGI